MDKTLSKTFDLLRFPLAVMVVYLHIDAMPTIKVLDFNWCNIDGSPLYYIVTILVFKIAALAVPCFFVMSGYLLFVNIQELSISVYISKIRRRIKTLLIPYFIWNLLAVVYLYVTQDVVFDNWSPIFLAPANFPLWFMRDLIFMTFLFPVFYWVVKLLGIYGAIILSIVYLCGIIPDRGICYFSSIFFFYIGCFWGIRRIQLPIIKSSSVYLLFYSIILIVAFVLYGSIEGQYWNRIYLMIGVFMVFVISYSNVLKHNIKVVPLLSASSFFIYVSHKLGFTYLSKLLFNYLPSNYYVLTLQFLVAPCIAVGLCLFVYFYIKKYCPKLLFITGGK